MKSHHAQSAALQISIFSALGGGQCIGGWIASVFRQKSIRSAETALEIALGSIYDLVEFWIDPKPKVGRPRGSRVLLTFTALHAVRKVIIGRNKMGSYMATCRQQ